ncbi:MAG: ATP-binding cassette domain-containing protein [Caldilineaceae bacterium]
MSILLEQLTKRYDGHPVVNNVSLEITDGEFFVLLGSSGSGKTTVLNMVAGLAGIDQGRVLLHGRDVTHLPIQERNVGYVFQNYALFQHMSVADNIEFGLRVRKVSASERKRRSAELLELIGLAGLGTRMPRQLSGGQQQRVALARALAHKPDVLLLDEPLGALDAKIRTELRRSLRSLQQELGITTIMVTHDQDEAFELADRMGVMSFGRLIEVGTPSNLYRYPQTEFVAAFLGNANLMVGQATAGGVQLGPRHFPLKSTPPPLPMDDARRVQVLFRPEDVLLAATSEDLGCPPLGQGIVEQITFAGSFERLRVRLPAIPGVRPIAPPVSFGEPGLVVEVTRTQDQVSRLPLKPNKQIWVGISRMHTLTHPGLQFLLLSDGSAPAQAALLVSSQIARLSHARVTLLGYGLRGDAMQRHLQEVKEQMGSGLASLEIRTTSASPEEAITEEVERKPYDLVVLGVDGTTRLDLAEQILEAGEHHLLLVPCSQPTPKRALICVASGEPGKEGVLFTARLIRHLGASATLLTILPESEKSSESRERVVRFLSGGVRTLQSLGVAAETSVRNGPVHEKILNELNTGNYDLLVLGAPLPDLEGKISLDGLVGKLLREVKDRSILIIRSSQQDHGNRLPLPLNERINNIKEIL